MNWVFPIIKLFSPDYFKNLFGSFVYLVSFFVFASLSQASLLTEQLSDEELDSSQRFVLEWKTDAADHMLKSGLAFLAEELYRELLSIPNLSSEEVLGLRIQLTEALIAQRKFEAARKILVTISEGNYATGSDEAYTARCYLFLAICAYGDGRNIDRETLTYALERVSGDGLTREDFPWLYLLKGLEAELSGRELAVGKAFDQALAAATSDNQRALFEGLIFREKILRAPTDELLAADAKARWKNLSGTGAAYPFVRQYAIILYNQGRTEEAIEVINQELAAVRYDYEIREREQLLLLKGILYGVDTLSGRDTLRTLLREGKSREVMAIALQLLARASDRAEQAEFSDFLNAMIARTEPHPLLGQLYYLRSQLALSLGENARAEADARLLLEQFPGLSEIKNVYRLLAYAALQREPPQYRAAANFLIQIRDQTELEATQQELDQLIGDCYFLNADYRNAVDFYQAAAGYEVLDADREVALFLRLVTAAVRSGQLEVALQHIGKAGANETISVADRWRAEWNVLHALLARGDPEVALERVRLLLESAKDIGSVPTGLDLRLRWLEARLSVMLGEMEDVLPRVDALLDRIGSIPDGFVDVDDIALLLAEVMFLKADILIKTGDSTAGIEIMKRLRADFAESSAAERSYLTEADYYASKGDFEAAEQMLRSLATTYATSRLAPQALYEAAIYCERRGAAYFSKAIRTYDELTGRYPQDPLYFFARLRQGDLLRQINDFAGAQIIYENLIRTFPEHPRRYVAELSRADCMLALAGENDRQLQDAALALEQLMDIPNLPIDFQVEAGFKWGFTLLKNNAVDEARVVFTLVFSQFLLDTENVKRLSPIGRYWTSRALFELGTLLEVSGEVAEARRVYHKILAYNLPGRNLARSRSNRLFLIDE